MNRERKLQVAKALRGLAAVIEADPGNLLGGDVEVECAVSSKNKTLRLALLFTSTVDLSEAFAQLAGIEPP